MRNVKSQRKSKRRGTFDNYDHENTFKHDLNLLSPSFRDTFTKDTFAVGYTAKTIKSGNQFEVELYPIFKTGHIPSFVVRKGKSNETKKHQRDLNSRNSRKRLERLIHTNFGPGDYWITLTFSNEDLPKGLEDAERLSRNYLKCINRLRKKKGLDNAKYVYVIEEGTYGTERLHLHLIMDGDMAKEDVEAKWKHGRVTNRTINYHGDESLMGLCKYLAKDPETYKRTSFRLKGKRSWGSSKGNLKEPTINHNRGKFSRAKVNKMANNQYEIAEVLEKEYPGYQFKEVEVRYNENNALYYIYARMHDRRPMRNRR